MKVNHLLEKTRFKQKEIQFQRFLNEVKNVNLEETVSMADINSVENLLNNIGRLLNIEVKFSQHFKDRINDPRNNEQITVQEIIKIFKSVFAKYGKQLSGMRRQAQAVLQDLSTLINIPLVIKWDDRDNEVDLIAKTIMRKQNFKSPDTFLKVESVLISV